MTVPNHIWILPRPRRDHYKGSVPLHFEGKLLRLLSPELPILESFGGMGQLGLRVDVNLEVHPDVQGDAHRLPFIDNVFGMVFCDPPYNEDYAQKLYHTRPAKYKDYIKEAVRVCKPGGFIVSYHWAVTPRPEGTSYYCRIFVGGRTWHRPRVACIFNKDK